MGDAVAIPLTEGSERRDGFRAGYRRIRRSRGCRRVSTLPPIAVFALAVCTASSPRAAEATADADGIVAEMRVAAGGLKIDWRFLRMPPAPIESITVTADGRPLPGPDGPLAAFPAPGQKAVIQILSDPDNRLIPSLGAADLASDLPAGVTVRAAASEAKAAVPRGDSLAAAIDRSLDDLGAETADRRALLLVAAGPDLASEPTLEAAGRARLSGIPVSVVLGRSASEADRAAATRLAQAGRGTLLDEEGGLASQVADTVLSGAELSFPFRLEPYLPWQSRTVTLRASLAYGGRILDLSTSLDRPPADRGQTAAATWAVARPLLPSFLAGVGLAVLVGSIVRARTVLARGGRT